MSSGTDDVASRLTDALELNSPDLLRYLERRMGREDAADGLAEVMMTSWRRVESLPLAREQARMWLFGIARNTVANTDRADRRRWRLADRLRGMLASAPASASPADDGQEVRDAIARLDPDQAELIRLVHWDGFTLVEASELIGIPASTARGRYQRVREQLKIALAAHQPVE